MNVRRAARPLCLLPVLLLAACLEMEQTITITQDGAGTQKLRLQMSPEVLAEARRAAAVTAPDGGAGPAQVFDRAAVEKELATAGLQLTAHRTFDKGQHRCVELEVAFKDLAGLRKSPLCGAAAEWEFGPGPVPDTVMLTLYPQGKVAWGKAREQAERWGAEPDAVAQSFFDKRKAQLAGLDVTMHFELPGRVLRLTRNMDQTGERKVTVRITADQIQTPADLMRRLAPRYEIVIDGRECRLPLDPK